MPAGPSTPGTSNPNKPNLFQLVIVLTENLNALICHVNAEKQARRMDPRNDEDVSMDEEEVDMPVSSVPLVPMSQTLHLPATLDTTATLPIETPEHTIGAHIPTFPTAIDTTTPAPLAPTHPTAPPSNNLTAVDWSALFNKIQAGVFPLAILPVPFESLTNPIISGDIPCL